MQHGLLESNIFPFFRHPDMCFNTNYFTLFRISCYEIILQTIIYTSGRNDISLEVVFAKFLTAVALERIISQPIRDATQLLCDKFTSILQLGIRMELIPINDMKGRVYLHHMAQHITIIQILSYCRSY